MQLAVLVVEANVTSTANNVFLTTLLQDSNQANVTNKVDISVVIELLLCNLTLVVKKAPINRVFTEPCEACTHRILVLNAYRPD